MDEIGEGWEQSEMKKIDTVYGPIHSAKNVGLFETGANCT